MLFNPIEIGLGRQFGINLFTFYWPSSVNTFLGLVFDTEDNLIILCILFTTYIFDFNNYEDDE